jgi:tetratricopeptide (TPR) repeat protein
MHGSLGSLWMRRLVVILLALSAAASAAEPESTTVIGVNESLSAGARALQMKDYEDGVRLTIEGLKYEISRRNRVSGLSNLCAGYTALQQYADAIASCNEAIEIDDNNWHAYNNRALAYLGQGDIEAAKRDLEAGRQLKPDSRKLLRVAEMIEMQENAPPVSIED